MLDYPPSCDAPTTFVEAVRAQNSAQVLHFTKSGTGTAPISFDVWQKRGSDVVNYRSYKGNAPFFYALKPVFVGPVTAAAPVLSGGVNPGSKTGTWINWDEPSNITYTAQNGATATVAETTEADELRLSTYVKIDGGPARAEIYDDTDTLVYTKSFTCYAATEATATVVLKTGLLKGKYKVVLRNLSTARLYVRLGFVSGGVRTPQAILSYVTQEMPPTIPGNPLSPYNGVWDMGQYSNKDFAYFIKEPSSSATEIVPTHSVLTEALASPIALWLDGTERSLAGMYSNETADADDRIDVMQHIYGFHTDNPSKNLIEVWMTATYLPDGVVEIRGRVKALHDIDFSGYPLMLPVPQRDGQCLFTSVGSQYQACEKPATASHDQYLDHAEGGKAFSYAYASTQLPNVIVALDVINPSVSLRPNAADRGGVLLNRRPASQLYVQKSYDEVFKDGTLAAGDEYAWSGRYIVGNIADPNRAMSRSVPGPRYPGFFVGPMPEPPADTMASTLPATQAFAKAGESVAISVAANGPWHVSVSGTGFSTSAVNGYGNGTVAVAASDNTGGSPRTGQVRLVCGTVLSTTTLTQE